jgi:hypothetical protein
MKTLSFFLLMVFIAIMYIMLFGCNTYKKQLKKSTDFFNQYPSALAPICAKAFPVKDSIGGIVVDTIHRANNINYQGRIDSIQAVADALLNKLTIDTSKSNPCNTYAKNYQKTITSLRNQVVTLKSLYHPCKPDTIRQTQTIYRTDVAALKVATDKYQVIRDSLKICQKQLSDETTTAHSWRKWFFICAGIIGISVLGTILKILGKI